jgi:hypothetical protein
MKFVRVLILVFLITSIQDAAVRLVHVQQAASLLPMPRINSHGPPLPAQETA